MRGPNSATSGSSSAAASSATVEMPSAVRRFEIFEPTPHSSIVGRWPMTSSQFSAVSRNTPCGLPNPVATFARTSVSPMPTLQCSRVRSSTARRTASAYASGSSVSTPRNASSQPSTCTVAPGWSRSVAMTAADAAVYASWSTGRITASGAFRAAMRSGMPEPTPKARASYDAVETTARSVGSPRPPTITGSPASSGRRSTSTAAMNWSRSTCSTQAATHPVCRAARRWREAGRRPDRSTPRDIRSPERATV